MLAVEFSSVPPVVVDVAWNKKIFGGDSGGVTPVPIPNTEVKPSSADGTWAETPWESRSPPDPFLPGRAVRCRPPPVPRPFRAAWPAPEKISGVLVVALAGDR